MNLIDVDAIQLDDNGKPQIDEVPTVWKKDPYLFKAEESKPSPNTSPQVTGAGAGEVDPFQADYWRVWQQKGDYRCQVIKQRSAPSEKQYVQILETVWAWQHSQTL